MFLNRIEAEPRGLVSAGAERHSGLDANDQVIVTIGDVRPRRRDDEAPNLDWLPALFPLFKPVAFGNFAQIHVAH